MNPYYSKFHEFFKENYDEKVVFSGAPRDILEETYFIVSRFKHKHELLFKTRNPYSKKFTPRYRNVLYRSYCREKLGNEIKSVVFELVSIINLTEKQLVKFDKILIENTSFISPQLLDLAMIQYSTNTLTLKSNLTRNSKLEIRRHLDLLTDIADSLIPHEPSEFEELLNK